MKRDELTSALLSLKPYAVLAFVISTAVGLLTLAPIGYMREVYGPVVTARSEPLLAWVTLILVFALAIGGALEWVRQRVQSAAAVRLSMLLGGRVFDASFKANLARMPNATMALSDFRVIRNFLSSPTAAAILDVPVGILMLGIIFYVHHLMGLLSLVGAFMTLVISLWTERRMRPVMTEAIERSHVANGYAADATRNAEAVAAMGMQPSIQKRWEQVQGQYLVQQAHASNIQASGAAVTKMVMLIQGSAILGLGTFLSLLGILSPNQSALLIVAKLIGAIAMRPVMTLVSSWKQVAMAWDSYERLRDFISRIPERQPGMPLPPPRGHLTVRNAAAVPPGGKSPILMDQNFEVPPGNILAVLGPSGSGKSSLARVITGLWPVRVGDVRLDGVNIAAWPKEELGPHLGYLPQDVELFDGTIAENIARFGPLDEEKLERAIASTGLGDLLTQLPDGLETQIGPDGARLSGGQRQRIGLARALYGNPTLIVLDEPNASLDAAGDQALDAAMLTAKTRGATVVIITHRREILARADLLLALKEGKPVAFGSRDKVLEHLKTLEGATN